MGRFQKWAHTPENQEEEPSNHTDLYHLHAIQTLNMIGLEDFIMSHAIGHMIV